jgi:hypothetical protein
MSILRTILCIGWFSEIAYTLFIENVILYEQTLTRPRGAGYVWGLCRITNHYSVSNRRMICEYICLKSI